MPKEFFEKRQESGNSNKESTNLINFLGIGKNQQTVGNALNQYQWNIRDPKEKGIVDTYMNINTLPLIKYREGYGNVMVSSLMEWIKSHDFPAYDKAKLSAEKRHQKKANPQAHVEYDLALYAFERYTNIINTKERFIQQQAGYPDEKSFEQEIQLVVQLGEALAGYKKKNFPNIDTTIDNFSKYTKEIETAIKNIGYNSVEQQLLDRKAYETSLLENAKIAKEKNIEVIFEQIQNPNIHSGEDLIDYFEKTNILLEYQQTCDKNKGKGVQKYENLVRKIDGITKKYGKNNIDNWSAEIDRYNIRTESFKKGFAAEINRARYEKYNHLLEQSGLPPYLKNKIDLYQIFQTIAQDPTSDMNPFLSLKKETVKEQEKQYKIDKRWERIKNNLSVGYDLANFGVGMWNGVVDFTIGTGTSLGLMIEKTWKKTDDWISEIDRQERWTNFFKIAQSSDQQKAIYQDGKLDFNRNNTVGTVGAQLSNMLALLSGAGVIGKGIAKGATNVGMKALSKKAIHNSGLFTTAFIQEVGRSFEEGITMGLTNVQALSYTLIQSAIGSGLELISPNEAIATGGGLTNSSVKTLFKTLFQQGVSKQGVYTGLKVFGKAMGTEIVEEILQESSQLFAENLINLWANDQWNVEFDVDFSWENFAQTIVLTALTTGLATSKSAGISGMQTMAISNNGLGNIRSSISKDPKLYSDLMNIIGKIETGKVKIPDIDLGALQVVKNELESAYAEIGANDAINDPSLRENQSQKIKTKEGEKDSTLTKESNQFFTLNAENELKVQENSKFMDELIDQMEGKSDISAELKALEARILSEYDRIEQQLKPGEEMPFTREEAGLVEDQLKTLIEAHQKDGQLGNLTKAELMEKVRTLAETIQNPALRRFLLEGGFSGQNNKIVENGKKLSSEELSLFIEELGLSWRDFKEGLRDYRNINDIYEHEIQQFLELQKKLELHGIKIEFHSGALAMWLGKKSSLVDIDIFIENKHLLSKEDTSIPLLRIQQYIDLIKNKDFFEKKLGIQISAKNVESFLKFTKENVEILSNNKNNIENKLKIPFTEENIVFLSNLTEEGIQWLIDNKHTIETHLNISFTAENVSSLLLLSREGCLSFLITNQHYLSDIGIQITDKNAFPLYNIFKGKETMLPLLAQLKIPINMENLVYGVQYLNTSNVQLIINHLSEIESVIGRKITENDLRSFSGITSDAISFAIKYKHLLGTVSIKELRELGQMSYTHNVFALFGLSKVEIDGFFYDRGQRNITILESMLEIKERLLLENIEMEISFKNNFDLELIIDGKPMFGSQDFQNVVDLYRVATDNGWNIMEYLMQYKGYVEKVPFNIRDVDVFNTLARKSGGVFSETFQQYMNGILRITENPISGIRNISKYLVVGMLNRGDINLLEFQNMIKSLEDIYTKNHLPEFYKKFLVHNIIKGNSYDGVSNMTKNIDGYNQRLILNDLIKSTIESNNLDFRIYLENLYQLKKLATKVENHTNLTHEELLHFNDGMKSVFKIITERMDLYFEQQQGLSPLEQIQQAIRLFKENPTGKERLFDLLESKVLGGNTIESLLDKYQQVEEVSKKHINLVKDGMLVLSSGEQKIWVKGVDSEYFNSSWDDGRNSPQLLGSETEASVRKIEDGDGDQTPYDVDGVSMNLKSDFQNVVERSYGDGLFLISVIDNRFTLTEDVKVALTDNYELIGRKNRSGNDENVYFRGVRHSLGSQAIDAIIAHDNFIADHNKMSQLKYILAKQGFYTPVADKSGKLVFSPAEYNELRKQFFATKYGENVDFSQSLERKTSPYVSEIQQRSHLEGTEITLQQSREFRDLIATKVTNLGFEMADKKGDQTKFLINEMGSTARGSDLGGEADFDYLVRLPITEGNNIEQIAKKIMSQFSYESATLNYMGEHGVQFYQIRLFGVDTSNGTGDLDIAVSLNDNFMETDPDLIISNKYHHIETQLGKNALEDVLANIRWTKKVLKDANCYKKGTHGQGGLGGLGVENWILNHNGDAIQAFASFYHSAYPNGETLLSWEEFKNSYFVLGVGNNARSGAFYENFVRENMTSNGYENMAKLSKKIYNGEKL